MENCLWNFYLPFQSFGNTSVSKWQLLNFWKNNRKCICLMSDVSMGMTTLQSEFRVQPVDVRFELSELLWHCSFDFWNQYMNFDIWNYEITKTGLMVKPFWGLYVFGGKKATTTQATQISRQANHWNSTLMSIPLLFFLRSCPVKRKRC